MGEVFLRRLSRWQAEQYREQLADLHGAAYGRPPAETLGGRAPFLEQLAGASARPGFDLMLADGGGPVGCAYGYPAARDGGLWRDFSGPVPEQLEELTAAGRVFVLAELMVLPRHRRQGLGRRLHDRLLSGSGAALAAVVLAPMDARSQAVRAARRAWGWSAAGTLRPAVPGGPAPEVFTRPLRR